MADDYMIVLNDEVGEVMFLWKDDGALSIAGNRCSTKTSSDSNQTFRKKGIEFVNITRLLQDVLCVVGLKLTRFETIKLFFETFSLHVFDNNDFCVIDFWQAERCDIILFYARTLIMSILDAIFQFADVAKYPGDYSFQAIER